MHRRLPLVLSTLALAVALLGSTSAGRSALDAAIPLAKRAYLADTAKNAIKVDNIKASRTPTPGMLLPLDASGKLPPEVGAVGPTGPAGPKGDKGKSGATNVVVRYLDLSGPGQIDGTVSCKDGERATGGGYFAGGYGYQTYVLNSYPVPLTDGSVPTGWHISALLPTTAVTYTGRAYVICASP